MIKRVVVVMISIAQPIGAGAPLEHSIALSDTQSVIKMLERRSITDPEMQQNNGQVTSLTAVEHHAWYTGYALADLVLVGKGIVYLSLGACGITLAGVLREITSIAHLTRRLQIVSFLSGGILGLHGLGFLCNAISKKRRVDNARQLANPVAEPTQVLAHGASQQRSATARDIAL